MTKKSRDPAKPKRALTAYQYFCADHRERVKEANPDAKHTDMFGLLSIEWKKVKPGVRGKYDALAAADKERYDAEMAAYVPTEGFERSGKPKRKAGATGPKRPLNAYQVYSKRHRDRVTAANPDAKHTEMFGLLSEEWKNASETEREACKAEAARLRAEYEIARAQWQEEHPEELHANKKAKTGRRKTKDPNAPKRPSTAYQLYSRAHRARVSAANPDAKHTDMFGLLAEQWKTCPPAERAQYEQEAATLRANYIAAKKKYESSGGMGSDE
ncbi:high-mobility protein [Thecamonas trahens ATCC 50062]|uniref:High-mobility protein n=1 Tax=Thecamonas trahens ATCC 50062 TaxID=461836 RepID=A0A0L0DGI8_THETB|nr:high-mobility protein [Thecamonas trahens ATCC 50062]KNC50453.1 high-mobility protein [Thecamonas trahens ATCC 50062]|eukprot:XP_013762349.1 high-mobility protein [Thecamonas trahens ATCC 50062]